MPARKITSSPPPRRGRIHIIPDDQEVIINPDSIGDGITQSEMTCWDNCAEKWYLGYNLMLYQVGKFSWPLTYGGWIHGALEEFYRTKGKRWSLECAIPQRKFIPRDQLALEDYWTGVADVQMQIYASQYKHDFEIWQPLATEEIVDLTWRGVRLKGMIDMPAIFLPNKKRKTVYIWDHKTSYTIDKKMVMGWDFRFQFMFYCWLATKLEKWKEWHIAGFVINAIRKPGLKWNQDKEILSAHLQRLETHMREEPNKYFYRDKLELTKDAMQHFEDHILGPKLDRIRILMDPKTPDAVRRLFMRNKNTDHCVSKFGTPCEFISACQNGLSLERFKYRKREVKHRELVSETED